MSAYFSDTSEIFHQSCYTARSAGYKYRTQATNTGEKRQIIDHSEDSVVDRKFIELNQAIFSKIDHELLQTQKSRDAFFSKLNKVSDKIDSMLSVQDDIKGLRKSINVVENKLADMVERVDRIDLFTRPSEECCVKSLNDFSRAKTKVFQKQHAIKSGSDVY